jgi:uncharacterized membrane protein YsdA (DUF1294 family)
MRTLDRIAAVRRGRPRSRFTLADGLRLGGAAALLLVALAATLLGRAPAWVPAAYLMLGAVSFAVYGFDKRAARNGDWLVTEGSLHGIDLIGGIAGGLLAQLTFRHKTRKQEFVAATVAIAALHLVLLATLALGLWYLPAVFFVS